MLTRAQLRDAVEVFGIADAPPLLLLHGLRLGRASWTPHVRDLERKFRTVTIDLPRHGALADAELSLEHVLQLMDYACTEVTRAPLVVGYSLGGFVAMLYAAVRPQHTRALALFSSTVDLVGRNETIYDALAAAGKTVPRTMFEMWTRVFFHALLPYEQAQTIVRSRFDKRAFEEGRRLFSGIAFSALLERYTRDVLIVNGQFDVPFRRATKPFAALCNAHTVVVTGADHTFPLRHVGRFCRILREWNDNLVR